jgi:hypothetical protein
LSAPIQVGGQTLEIPFPPDTDVALSEREPQFLTVAQAYIGNNRLLEIYAAQAEAARMQDGLSHYCQLQVNRQLEDKTVALEEFGRQQPEIEKGMAKVLGGDEFDSKVREAEASGNRQLQQSTGSDAHMTIDKPRYHGIYAREPWGLFFSMEVPVNMHSDGASTASVQAAATGLVDAGGKILSLNCYREQRDAQDLQRVRAQARTWAQAVSAANPAPAGDSHAFGGLDLQRLFDWRKAVPAIVVSGIIGLIAAIVAARRKRR